MSSRDTTATIGALTFDPRLEKRVWGGRKLESFGRDLPEGERIGESWEISAIQGRSTRVTRGAFAGSTFEEILAERSADVIGDVAVPSGAVFPLLLKLLDSSQPLSIQLHPSDAEAVEIEGDGPGSVGKTEAWVILEADEGAEINHGLAPGVKPSDLYDRLEALEGRALDPREERELFRWVPVRAGDVVFVPAGTIHALGAGVVLMEVQQSSDITYRIYDWGRPDDSGNYRELHVDKSRRVELRSETPCPWSRLADAPRGETVSPLVECDQFRIELVSLGDGGSLEAVTETPDGRPSFHILFGWDGAIEYASGDGDRLSLSRSSFVLLPASLGEYELTSAAGVASRCLRITGGAAPSTD